MTPDRWQILTSLFHGALERQAGERAAWVAEQCGDDGEMRSEVERMVEEYLAEPDFLEETPGRAVLSMMEENDPTEGAQIGVYRVVRRIGDGGMGSVYLAERDDREFRRRVALKLVKRGMDSEEIVRRFRAERQIHASLAHPGIAALLDGGISADGRPYFVMEYIERGVPITTWCDTERLPLRRRLDLFRAVCDAVQHAHRNLVVHRDLKPANILVNADGYPKLLDFGIAKLLGAEREQGTLHLNTRADLRLLTPDYAAPEQIRGGTITTACDVYALGALLYELLTGCRPHRLSGRSTVEIERIICTVEPERPSAVVGIDQMQAAARGVSPLRLKHELRGDLETIVLKAMAKDPARRYGSAEQLAEDIGRWLEGMPIIARPDSVGYRMGRFVGRHRIGVAGTFGAFVTLAGFGLSMAAQSRRIGRQAREIARERDKAREVVAFLKELFALSDPNESRGRETTARELLARGAERIAGELRHDPLARAELTSVIAEISMSIGLFDDAERLARETLHLFRSRLPAHHTDVVAAMLLHTKALRMQGRYSDAEALCVQALDLVGEEDGTILADALNEMGIIARILGRAGEAEEFYRRAIVMQISAGVPDMQRHAQTINNLAILLKRRGVLDEAEELYRRALEMQERGEDDADMATTLNNLASLLRARNDLDAAEEIDRRALKIRRRVLREHPGTAQSLNNLAATLLRRGRSPEAETLLREALAIWERHFDSDHPEIASGIHNLAQALRGQGNHGEAEILLRRALSIRRDRLGEHHPQVAATLVALGDLLEEVGRGEEAVGMYGEAYRMHSAAHGPNHPQTVALNERWMAVGGG